MNAHKTAIVWWVSAAVAIAFGAGLLIGGDETGQVAVGIGGAWAIFALGIHAGVGNERASKESEDK